MNDRTLVLAAAALVGLAGAATSAVSDVNAVVLAGDVFGGRTVDSVGGPTTSGDGSWGVIATMTDGSRSVIIDGNVVFNSVDDAPVGVALTGGESSFGIGNSGQFLYSPSVDGDDSVWADDGLVQRENTPAPGFPANINNTFNSRPYMTDAGTRYWVSGFNDGMGGTSSQGRMLYRQTPGGTPTIVAQAFGSLANDGGLGIDDGSGIDFDFRPSDDDSQFIHVVNLNSGSSANDSSLVVNGTVINRETFATGQGDNWDNFDYVSINNAGNYLNSGDTDGATTSDEYIAYNGNISIREGDTLDGFLLTATSTVRGVSINDNNEAVHIWGDTGVYETLFYAADASDLSSSVALLSIGDELDFDGNGDADWIVDDFNAFSEGLDLQEDGFVYVEVDLFNIESTEIVEAVLQVRVPAPGASVLLAAAGLAATRRRR